MAALKCDVCGGGLSIDAGGETATCEYCGAKHSMERMREKVQEIKGTVSISGTVQTRHIGSEEDVKQWKQLLDKYMKNGDYEAALSIAQKILEAAPTDDEANKAYDELQEYRNFVIRGNILVEYRGEGKIVNIPEKVERIAKGAFQKCSIEQLKFPEGIKEIVRGAFEECSIEQLKFPEGFNGLMKSAFLGCFIKQLWLPEGLKEMGDGGTDGIFSLSDIEELVLPDTLERINQGIFFCTDVKDIKFGKGLKYIGQGALASFHDLETIELPESIEQIEPSAFPPFLRHLVVPQGFKGSVQILHDCRCLATLDASPEFIERAYGYFSQTPNLRKTKWYLEMEGPKKLERKKLGVCQYCGGEFKKVLMITVCSVCGKKKDY